MEGGSMLPSNAPFLSPELYFEQCILNFVWIPRAFSGGKNLEVCSPLLCLEIQKRGLLSPPMKNSNTIIYLLNKCIWPY